MEDEEEEHLDSVDYLNQDSAKKEQHSQREELQGQEHEGFAGLSKLPYNSASNFLNIGSQKDSPGKKSPSPLIQHFNNAPFNMGGIQSQGATIEDKEDEEMKQEEQEDNGQPEVKILEK